MDVAQLARDGLAWLVGLGQETDAGLAWPPTPADETDSSLYEGGAGIVVTFLEAYRHFGDDRYGDAAVRGAREIAAVAPESDDCSLYVGATGMAVALRAVHDVLDEPWAGVAADRALDRVRTGFDGDHWNEYYDVIGGNAGIALGALAVGDVELAQNALTRFLHMPEPTPGGVRWQTMPGPPSRMHHVSHGTLGIVLALATVGQAAGRSDLIELALAGAADVVSRNEAGPDGFLVAHSDPAHKPETTPRYSYGWCHGPTGDAHVFRSLAAVTGDVAWSALADRCWHTVTTSGLPQRLRPGFWDNIGRCCGTAGVLALACDREVENGDGLAFAEVLVDDLAHRATWDASGARWSNHEHKADPSTLAPRTGWAMGNAGIVRELLRYARLTDGRDPAYAVDWPDHPPALAH